MDVYVLTLPAHHLCCTRCICVVQIANSKCSVFRPSEVNFLPFYKINFSSQKMSNFCQMIKSSFLLNELIIGIKLDFSACVCGCHYFTIAGMLLMLKPMLSTKLFQLRINSNRNAKSKWYKLRENETVINVKLLDAVATGVTGVVLVVIASN